MVPQAIRMAENAFRRYKTRDPYEIIEARRILLKYYDRPGSLLGFYTVMNRKQVIGINNNATEVQQKSGLYHEIGHSLNDFKTAASGFRFDDTKFFSLSNAPCEYNANLTAAELFITDEFILENIHYSAYERMLSYISEKIDSYRTDNARMAFEKEQIQEFYDIHSDMPSFDNLAAMLGLDEGVVKFKFKALQHKGYELPNIPETKADFLRNWMSNSQTT